MRSISLIILSLCSIILLSCKPTTEDIPDAAIDTGFEIKTSGLDAWAEAPRNKITNWVQSITDSGSADFIPIADRIAVFDNDGTLWPEQPYPNQAQFAFDYVKAHAADHPEWQKDVIISGVAKGDMKPLMQAGIPGLLKVINASHANIKEEDFQSAVLTWLDTAKDGKYSQPFDEVIYLPMVQLLDYLRAHDFKTFIVSGGGADFMRAWTEEAYGIPPYQVVGSYGEAGYDVADGEPLITKTSGDIYIDDKAAKPVAIHRFIGKVPVFCGGNSDGDQAMMQYTSGSKYNTMCLILHHTDAEREYAYDTKTLSGHLETALDEAKEKDWLVVDMKSDFKKIFAFE